MTLEYERELNLQMQIERGAHTGDLNRTATTWT